MNSLFQYLPLLAQTSTDTVEYHQQGNPVAGVIGGLVGLVIGVFMIVCVWKVYVKAGYPGWTCIIPIYGAYILCKIAGKPGWWLILMLVPFVNVVIFILLGIGIAKNFGKSAGFGIGLLLLGVIFFPILAFGDAQYRGDTALPPAL